MEIELIKQYMVTVYLKVDIASIKRRGVGLSDTQ